jgi:hypothetical protein
LLLLLLLLKRRQKKRQRPLIGLGSLSRTPCLFSWTLLVS